MSGWPIQLLIEGMCCRLQGGMSLVRDVALGERGT